MTPAYRITISKRLVTGDHDSAWRWVASAPECLLSEKEAAWRTGPIRSEVVEWVLEAPATSAHIQFTDMDLFENTGTSGAKDLTDDMTAEVRPGTPLQLKMKGRIPLDHPPRKHFYYAVWVREGAGGEFAIGETLNPPPDVTLGP